MNKLSASKPVLATTYNTEKKIFVRFLSKLTYDNATGCWTYSAGKAAKSRYGQFWDGRQNVNAHKYAYDSMVDSVPSDRVLCHSCDNKACCSPWHLRVQTQKQNMIEASERGLLSKPRRKYRRITTDTLADIRKRAANGQTAYAIGKALDISAVHIYRILAGKRHKADKPAQPKKIVRMPKPKTASGVSVMKEAA